MLIMPKKRSRWVIRGLFCFNCVISTVGLERCFINSFFSQSLADNLDCCGRALSELDAAVQEFGRRNPLLAKQLSDAIGKLSEMHHHTTRLADCRNNWLKKVCVFRSSVHSTSVMLIQVSFNATVSVNMTNYQYNLLFCVVP